MWTALFIITTVICAGGWLFNHISALILACYITKFCKRSPSEEEIEECKKEALKHLSKKFRKR